MDPLLRFHSDLVQKILGTLHILRFDLSVLELNRFPENQVAAIREQVQRQLLDAYSYFAGDK